LGGFTLHRPSTEPSCSFDGREWFAPYQRFPDAPAARSPDHLVLETDETSEGHRFTPVEGPRLL